MPVSYTYELCFFKEAKQIPSRGGSTFSLGYVSSFSISSAGVTDSKRSRFDSWNKDPNVKPGTPEYYSKMHYKHGTRCWNGPERSVVVSVCLLFSILSTLSLSNNGSDSTFRSNSNAALRT